MIMRMRRLLGYLGEIYTNAHVCIYLKDKEAHKVSEINITSQVKVVRLRRQMKSARLEPYHSIQGENKEDKGSYNSRYKLIRIKIRRPIRLTSSLSLPRFKLIMIRRRVRLLTSILLQSLQSNNHKEAK